MESASVRRRWSWASSRVTSVGPSRLVLLRATLADLDSAPIEEPLRATLRLLGKLTRENRLNPDDVRRTLAAGVSAQQIKDALAVAFAFNVTDRLADTFGFAVDDRAAIRAGAKYLLSRGYG